jgi:molybdopterin-guanine dinucleotide biosynthesis protein A
MKQRPFGLLLAGGRSRRMGQDKARLEYAGRTQLERGLELLESFCEETFLSIRRDQRAPDGVVALPDNYPDAGPLGGIVTGFDFRADVSWFVIACDLPFLDRRTLSVLVSQRDREDRAVYAYASAHDGLPEPLCAIYEPVFAETLRRNLAKHHYCPRRILREEAVPLLNLPESARDSLDNINTPEEFAEATARLGLQ